MYLAQICPDTCDGFAYIEVRKSAINLFFYKNKWYSLIQIDIVHW